jgi:hypothetical protein
MVMIMLFSLSIFAQTEENQDPPVVPPPPEEPATDEQLLQRIEGLIEDIETEEDADYSELIQQLEVFLQSPINLNTAKADDLRRLIFLNDIQINNLLNHIRTYGNLISIYELQAVDGFDFETIQNILPYVTVQEAVARRQITFNDVLKNGKSQFFLRYQQTLEEQKGYSPIEPEDLEANPNARYLGSPYRLYQRYRFTYYNNISIGMTAQKNPGEEFFKGSQPYGYDFYSGHAFFRDFGVLKTLALGDFQAQFGQGLALWTGLAFGKSADVINVKKNALGFKQYTSVDQQNYLRGAGTTLKFNDLEVSTFFSYKKLSANILRTDTIEQEDLEFTSIDGSGNHRTPGELEKKNALGEMMAGGNLKYTFSNLTIGTTAYYQEFDADYNRRLSYYNQFDFNSKTNYVFGADYNYIFRNFNLFGEYAQSQSKGHAFVSGMMASLGPVLSLSAVYRDISPDYQSMYSSAFGENSRTYNEKGLFIGAQARFSRAWSVSAYADHFSFPWMKYRTYVPSQGYDYLVQVNHRPRRGVEVYLRYKIKNKPLNSSEAATIRYLDDAKRQNVRLHASIVATPTITLRNRIELIKYEFGSKEEYGYLIYQDVSYRSKSTPFTLTVRYALFDTDGYDSRIYAYENDVLYAFSFPFYSDKGSRAYALVRYSISRNIDLYIRYAQTFYTNRNVIGSGLEEIQGNTRSEIKAQIRLRF